MKKQNVILTIVGLVALVGGGILVYRLFTKPTGANAPAPQPLPSSEPETPVGAVTSTLTQAYQQTGDILGGVASTISDFLGGFNSYSVNTISTNLYLRENPDANAKIIGKYAKGTIVKAKPSSVKGWFAVSEDGKTIKGYVSSVYLKAEPTK